MKQNYIIKTNNSFGESFEVCQSNSKGNAFLICKLLNDHALNTKSDSQYYVAQEIKLTRKARSKEC